MKKILGLLLLTSLLAFGANEYKQPNASIFYKTLTLPTLNTSGVITNTSGGTLGTVTKIPIANGGTNSSNTLSNSKVIVSSGGTIGESTTTTTQLSYLDATSSIQTQINGKQATLTLPLTIVNGGTNTGNTLSNNSFIVSSGGTIGEAAPITARRSVWSDANGLPVGSNSLLNNNRVIVSSGGTLAEIAAGTSAQVLTSNGSASAPSWQAGTVALGSATGTLAVAHGGTNSTIALNNNRLVVTSGGTIGELTSNGNSGNILQSNGNAAPTWVTNAPVATNITGTLAVAHGGTNSTITLNNNRIIVSSGGTIGELTSNGISGQVLSSNGNAAPTWIATPSGTIAKSTVYLDTGNGLGGSVSGDTMIRNFTNNTVVGSALTYTARTTTAADFITVVSAGVYAITYDDGDSLGGSIIGISINSSQTSTSVGTITASTRLAASNVIATASYGSSVSAIWYLNANDVIRAHTDGGPDGARDATQFRVVKVSN